MSLVTYKNQHTSRNFMFAICMSLITVLFTEKSTHLTKFHVLCKGLIIVLFTGKSTFLI